MFLACVIACLYVAKRHRMTRKIGHLDLPAEEKPLLGVQGKSALMASNSMLFDDE